MMHDFNIVGQHLAADMQDAARTSVRICKQDTHQLYAAATEQAGLHGTLAAIMDYFACIFCRWLLVSRLPK